MVKVQLSEVAFPPALRGALSVAITRAFGLCCQFGVTGVVTSRAPFALDWSAQPGENAEGEITPALSCLVLRGSNIRASYWAHSTNNADRTASAKDAVNEIQCAHACGFWSYARLSGLDENSRRF